MDDAVGWIVAFGFCYITFKYFFSGSSGSNGHGSGAAARARRAQVPQAAIDQLTTMFPHIPPRNIRYELENNGLSVERAVERALATGTLPQPPASFFPQVPTSTAAPSTTTTGTTATPGGTTHLANSSTSGNAQSTTTAPASLIKRMGLTTTAEDESNRDDLTDKGKGKGKETSSSGSAAGPVGTGWATTAQAREQSLLERKQKMVLDARRKMLEKERAKKERVEGAAIQSSSSSGHDASVVDPATPSA